MPRYFFDLRDGSYIPDTDGTDLADLRTARIAAVELAGILLKEGAAKFWDGLEWRIEVKDEAGLILFVLDFSATDSPAVSGLAARPQWGAGTH